MLTWHAMCLSSICLLIINLQHFDLTYNLNPTWLLTHIYTNLLYILLNVHPHPINNKHAWIIDITQTQIKNNNKIYYNLLIESSSRKFEL
jgi:hypothetical protein